MTCDKSNCDADDTDVFEVTGPSGFEAELCEDHEPTFATAEASD